MKRLLSTVGAGAALLLTLTACGSAEGTPTPSASGNAGAAEVTDFDSLVEAAQAEGSLRVYGQIPEPSLVAFAEAFQEKYGIQVEALRLGGNTLAQRFETEVQAGTPSADLVIPVDVEFVKTATEAGSLVAFSDTGVLDYLEGFPEEAVYEEYDTPDLQVMDVGFIYNTDKVKASEIPDSWSELSSPRWSGKFCAVDAGSSLNTGHFFWKLREEDGEDAVVEFGDNVGRWYPNVIAMNEAVAVGECELGVGSAKFFVEQAKETGAAVEAAPQPWAIRPLTTAAVATKAQSPNAAKLFLQFILSEEGNALMNDPAVGSLGPWDIDKLPADFTVPSSEEFNAVRAQLDEVVALLG